MLWPSKYKSEHALVALGGSITAGVGDFGLSATSQKHTYVAQFAAAAGIAFHQPAFDPPGIPCVMGMEGVPVRLPGFQQSTVFGEMPPLSFDNLAVPGFSLADCLGRSATHPLVDRANASQTACNMLIGALPLARRPSVRGPQTPPRLPTPAQAAAALNPQIVVVEQGFDEAFTAALSRDRESMRTAVRFRSDLESLLRMFPNTAIVLATVPDPFDLAYFPHVEGAAMMLRVEPRVLTDLYRVPAGDLLPMPVVNEIAFQLFARKRSPLERNATFSAAIGRSISARIDEWNLAVTDLAKARGCALLDLAGLWKESAFGMATAARRIDGGYLGGFFGVNAWAPGRTAHAIIANRLADAVRTAFGAPAFPVPVDPVAKSDPAVLCKPARGRRWTPHEVSALPLSSPQPAPPPIAPAPRAGTYPLRLPANGKLDLRLDADASYFGDGISANSAEDPNGIFCGTSGDVLFGGLAMVDSHLAGTVRIEFKEMTGGKVRFTLSFLNGLTGEDAELACPQWFRMAFAGNRVEDAPGTVSEGLLDLATGAVSGLRVFAAYQSGALSALYAVNKGKIPGPLSFVSDDIATPLEWGSAWAQFTPRADGQIDFTFYGTRYVPLRDGIVWPLNFRGAEPVAGDAHDFATIPAPGTVMHPHLRLSTAPPAGSAPARPIRAPENQIVELTLHTHNSAFGDLFSLDIPKLGGPAKGRSHVLGRVELQFGKRSRNTIPVAAFDLAPGGIFAPRDESPIAQEFPGRLPPGPTGFYETLQFPQRLYSLDELSVLDDPFDPAIGALDARTGQFLNGYLHRGFIQQDLIYSLVRVEPRTPKISFLFRGPACLERIQDDTLLFRFRGQVHLPYPAQLRFPEPNLSMAYTVQTNSALDPFLWLRGAEDIKQRRGFRLERKLKLVSSTGDRFVCEFRLPADPGSEPFWFEYRNESQAGEFLLHSLSWIGFARSVLAQPGSPCDTVTFAGFGKWTKQSKSSLQQIAAQICVNPRAHYVGVQIDSADVSNANTKPAREQDALP